MQLRDASSAVPAQRLVSSSRLPDGVRQRPKPLRVPPGRRDGLGVGVEPRLVVGPLPLESRLGRRVQPALRVRQVVGESLELVGCPPVLTEQVGAERVVLCLGRA